MSNIINGNIEGIKDYVLEGLKTLYDIKVEKSKLFSAEIINQIAEVSFKINREINVAVDRKGKVIEVSIGDLPKMCLISSLLTEPFAPIITCLKDLKKSVMIPIVKKK